VFAQLGDIQFDLITYFEGLDGTIGYNFAEHAVIEGKPHLQFIGDGLEAVNLALRFHQGYCDPQAEFKRLKDAAAKHEALPFLFGNGLYKGRYVITEITDTVETTASDGTVISLEAKIALKEWVEDKPLEVKKQQQKAKAPARKKKKHAKRKVEDVPQLTPASKRAGYVLTPDKDKWKVTRSSPR